jgi:hypothetical protein
MYKLLSDKTFALSRLFLYAAGYSFFFASPAGFIENRSFCIFYNTLGIKCPGCGMTRAFYNAFHGNLTQAIQYNWLVLILFPILVILSIEDSWTIIKRLFLRLDFDNPHKYISLLEKIFLLIYIRPHKKA